MHPVWFWEGDAPYTLVTARPTPLKVRHLATHRGIAYFYWDPAHDTARIDATATWLNRAEYPDAWRQIATVAPPVVLDPAIFWPDGPDSPDCAFLRFDAHRAVATRAGRPSSRWTGRRSTPSTTAATT